MTDETDAMHEVLRGVWERQRPVALARIAVARAGLDAAAAGCLAEEAREAAFDASHKLAGSLGTFGFPEGSALSGRLETFFRDGDGDPEALRTALDALDAALSG